MYLTLFSVETNLQRISSIFFVVETKIFVSCKHDPDAANLRPALEQGCGKQTMSAIKLSSRANMLFVLDITMQKSLRCRSVHFLGTCEKKTAAQCQIPIFSRAKNIFFGCHCAAVFFSQVPKKCTDLDFSLLYILIFEKCSKFAWHNSFVALVFAFCSPARALAAGLPRQDSYRTNDELFRFHNKKFDEMRCELDSTENPRSFEKYPPHLKQKQPSVSNLQTK